MKAKRSNFFGISKASCIPIKRFHPKYKCSYMRIASFAVVYFDCL